jgi:uncharacterized spore protein YtfJ
MTTTMTRPDSAVLETIREVADNAGADKVFGEPITHNGVVLVPVAKVSGGGGGGSGTQPAPDGHDSAGAGGGIGLRAKPLGVFVLKDGEVTWRPAVDVNRAILGGQLVALAVLLLGRAVIKSRRKRRR